MVREAEALDPSYIILFNVARILYLTGEYEEAVQKAQEVVLEQGSYTEPTLYLKAHSHYMLGEYAATLNTLEQAGAGEQIEAAKIAIAAGAPPITGDPDRDLLLRAADIGVAPTLGEPTDLLAARLWVAVNRDSALVRLEKVAANISSWSLRADWFDVIADATFDGIRDDPRLLELNASFGL